MTCLRSAVAKAMADTVKLRRASNITILRNPLIIVKRVIVHKLIRFQNPQSLQVGVCTDASVHTPKQSLNNKKGRAFSMLGLEWLLGLKLPHRLPDVSEFLED